MTLHVAVLVLLALLPVLIGLVYVGGGWINTHWYAIYQTIVLSVFLTFTSMAGIMLLVSQNNNQHIPVPDIGDTYSEEERGSICAESFAFIIDEVGERDWFAAKTVSNFGK
jgi:hypothetical protein